MAASLWLIAGLGNPGRKYERNRHNIGFRIVDELVRRHSLGRFRAKLGAETASGLMTCGSSRHKVLLIKPMQFMNRSGFAIVRAAQFFDVAPDKILVIHDEIDIEFGRIKLKSGGGAGGHNGVRSIIAELGSRDFLRVRVGVGKPGPPPGQAESEPGAGRRDARVTGHVLSDFPSAMEPDVARLVETAADATETIVAQGIRAAMNKFHQRPARAPVRASEAAPEKPLAQPASAEKEVGSS